MTTIEVGTEKYVLVSRDEAAFLIQCMIISRSSEVSTEASETRKQLAHKFEKVWPGVVEENFGGILLK